MVRTFGERQKERSKEEAEDKEGEDLEFWQRSETNYSGRTLEQMAEQFPNVIVPTPDELQPDGITDRQKRRAGDTAGLAGQVAADLGRDPQQLSNELKNIDVDELSGTALERVSAQMDIYTVQLLRTMLNTQVSMLQAMVDTADAVEPPQALVFDGQNTVDNAGEPQPLVPNSDDQGIETKTIYVRAETSNTDPIYIGDDSVDPESGFILKPGESWELRINLSNDIYHMTGDTEGDGVRLLGVL